PNKSVPEFGHMRYRTLLVAGGLVVLAAWSAFGAAAASHRQSHSFGHILALSWSPDGKQIAVASISPVDGGYRIVRTSSRPGGATHTVVGSGAGVRLTK